MGNTSPIRSLAVTRGSDGKVVFASVSAQGRRPAQEDEHVAVLALPRHPLTGMFSVFDGHGGRRAAVHLRDELPKRLDGLQLLDKKSLERVVIEMDEKFCTTRSAKGVKCGDGSTCNCVLIDHSTQGRAVVTCMNLGDSLAFCGRNDRDDVEWLSTAHKPDEPSEKKRIEDAGGKSCRGRVKGLSVSRTFGDCKVKDWKTDKNGLEIKHINFLDLDPRRLREKLKSADFVVSPVPSFHISTFETSFGDWIFVCCDGYVEALAEHAVASFVKDRVAEQTRAKQLDPATILKDLTKLSFDAGSTDNHTAILICFDATSVAHEPTTEFVFGTGAYDTWAEEDFSERYTENAIANTGLTEDAVKRAAYSADLAHCLRTADEAKKKAAAIQAALDAFDAAPV